MDSLQVDSRLAELRNSARGWHGVQLAVLGFIGLCGVLSGDSAAPDWFEWLSMWLALAALAVACLATFLVGLAAWPLYRAGPTPSEDAGEVERTSRGITSGPALSLGGAAPPCPAPPSPWWGAAGGGTNTAASHRAAAPPAAPGQPESSG